MTKTPLIRRLEHEFELMRELARASSQIRFTSRGVPPTEYTVALSCGGLVREGDAVSFRFEHQFVIMISEDFPIVAPNVFWQTPIYHPNFRAPFVCLGDAWYAGSTLSTLCETLSEMVQYRSFNLADPLHKEAANWVKEKLQSGELNVPIDAQQVADPNFELKLVSRKEVKDG